MLEEFIKIIFEIIRNLQKNFEKNYLTNVIKRTKKYIKNEILGFQHHSEWIRNMDMYIRPTSLWTTSLWIFPIYLGE